MKELGKIKYWGASTAAHQVEGNNTNQWSLWEKENATRLAGQAEEKYADWLPSWEEVASKAKDPSNYMSGAAVDHYSKYQEDFDILSSLSMNGFRFSIEWSRIEPSEGKWDQAEIDHYKEYVAQLKKRGTEPMPSMWHWTVPVWFDQMGGFENKRNVRFFVRFCAKMAEELGDQLNIVFTLNEPNSFAAIGYLLGNWPPQKRNPIKAYKVMKNLALASNQATAAMKGVNPKLKIGSVYQLTYIKGLDMSGRVIERVADYVTNWWWLDKVKDESDFIGLNYYFTNEIKGLKRVKPNVKRSDYGWSMEPRNLQFMIEKTSERYGLPIHVTENGLADSEDKNRQWWIEETLKALSKAIAKGADIRSYLHWSLLDNFEWADGFWPEFGLVKVDRTTMKRTVRPSAKWFGAKIAKIQEDSKWQQLRSRVN